MFLKLKNIENVTNEHSLLSNVVGFKTIKNHFPY